MTWELQERVHKKAHTCSHVQNHKAQRQSQLRGTPPGELQWVGTAQVCRVWYVQKRILLNLKDLLKKGDLELVALGQRFPHGHICSDPLTRSRKPSGNKRHTDNQVKLSRWPNKGWGNSTKAKTAEKLSGRPLPQKADWKNR